ncbi:Ribonuclease 3 [Pleurostoma richardsiae]|uniref:Ribonuclease 3 n=1 Tax=Pleurostoma richardsiae TaxID=41990 RepID=A0AA38RUY5_9PEZI|nr:Ribonuclease 3 [Pleurostoma richardsiae]
MKAPFSLNVPKVPARQVWQVNEDPEKLDRFYERFLGREGLRMLPDELKWLAVTHKSFDQGRRGFNTRLAFFGRQIIILEAMRSIVTSPTNSASKTADPFNRKPFEHPALASVDNLAQKQPQDMVAKERLARLAVDFGLHEVTRWKPRVPENLKGSGLETVLNTSLFAIIGAISLQHGAEVAGRVVRERILRRIE